MLKLLALALALPLSITACKSESTTGTAASSASSTEVPATGPRRTGKIDMPTMRRPPAGADDPDQGPPAEDRPRGEVMKPRFEDMRKQREAKLDTDGDGKISEAERLKARHQRADTMRSRMDANGDGKVTAEELESKASGRFANRLGDGATIDTNKDGDISADELDAALGRRGPRGSAAPQ